MPVALTELGGLAEESGTRMNENATQNSWVCSGGADRCGSWLLHRNVSRSIPQTQQPTGRFAGGVRDTVTAGCYASDYTPRIADTVPANPSK